MEHEHQKIRKILNPILYFHPDYLETQQYSTLKVLSHGKFSICLSIEGHTAKSLPKSPFGGIYVTDGVADFMNFQSYLENELKQSQVNEIIINPPPGYYEHFVPENWLQSAGYQRILTETNQYMLLSEPLFPRLHPMEKRKLKNKCKFVIRKTDEIPEVHQFIARCRKHAGLEVNISEERLTRLIELFPDRYEIFEARKEGMLAAVVVMNLPADNIAYYYLPATNPEFKKLSPMVSLIQYIYDYYQARKIRYLDLGISSINGDLQTSLYTFKQRMGAKATTRTSWRKSI